MRIAAVPSLTMSILPVALQRYHAARRRSQRCGLPPPAHRHAASAVITPADLANKSFISMAHGDALRAPDYWQGLSLL